MSAARAIALLRDAYPRHAENGLGDRTVTVYGTMLADLDETAVVKAVERLILRSPWLPTVAEIRREVAEAALLLPAPLDAWQLVFTRRWVELPPEVQATCRALGGTHAIKRESGNGVRREFCRAYEQLRERTVLAYMGAAPMPPMLDQPREPVRALPVSSRIRPRPIMTRLMHRLAGRELWEPTEEEKADAIKLLAPPIPGEHYDPVGDGDHDPLYREAESVFAWADRNR